MPQIRVTEESYRLLKERATKERRTLSNMVEVLLIPTVDDPNPPTSDDNLPTHVDKAASLAVRVAMATERHAVCTCGPGERAKGKHNKWCPMKGK